MLAVQAGANPNWINVQRDLGANLDIGTVALKHHQFWFVGSDGGEPIASKVDEIHNWPDK